jgi:hypothetical protein
MMACSYENVNKQFYSRLIRNAVDGRDLAQLYGINFCG